MDILFYSLIYGFLPNMFGPGEISKDKNGIQMDFFLLVSRTKGPLSLRPQRGGIGGFWMDRQKRAFQKKDKKE